MNKQLMNAYDKLKMNLIQTPASFDLLLDIVTNPSAHSLDEVIKYDKLKLARPDGNDLTNAILEAVCNVCNLSPNQIFSRQRYREFNDGRIIYTAFLRMGTNWSYSKIASHLMRNHATMIHNIKNFSALSQTDKVFAKKINQIIKILNSKKIYTFDDILTTNKWKYERTDANLSRSAKIARKTRLLNREERKRQQQIHTANA